MVSSIYQWASYYEEEIFLSNLFMVSLICFSHYGLRYFYFFYWVIIHYYHYVSWCPNCHRFGQRNPLHTDSCVLLTCPHHSLSTSLLSGEKRYSQIILCFLCTALQSGIFSKKPPVSGEWSVETKMWGPCMLVATGVSLLKFLSSFMKEIWGREVNRQDISIPMISLEHTHSPIIYVTLSSHWYLQFQSQTTGFILILALSVLITPFSNSEKSGFHYPPDSYLFAQS